MKSILLSVQPQWVKNILNGEKTIEVRKTMPKCKLPVSVFDLDIELIPGGNDYD